MADQSTLETLLKLQVDSAAAKKVLDSINRTQNAMADLRKATIAQDAAAAANTRTIQQQVKAIDAQSAATMKAIKASQANAGQSIAGLRGLVGTVGGGGLSNALGTVDDLSQLASEMENLKATLKSIPDVAKQTVASIGLTGVGVGAALVALGVAAAALDKAMRDAYAATQTRIKAEQDFIELTSKATSEQLAKQKADLQATLSVRQAQFDVAQKALQDLIATAETATDKLPEGVSVLSLLLNKVGVGTSGSLQAAQEAADAAKKALDDTAAALDNVTRAANDNRVAQNDAVEAAKRTLAELTASQDRYSNATLNTQLEINRLNSESARERLKAIQQEYDAIAAAQAIEGTSADQQKALDIKREQLGVEQYLISTALGLIDARTRETAALEETKKRLADTVSVVQTYNDNVGRLQQQVLESSQAAHERYLDKVQSIAFQAAASAAQALQNLEQRRADLALSLSRAGEEAQIKAAEAALDLQIENQRAELKSLRTFQDDVRRIRREGQRAELDAIGSRDAVQLAAAQENTRNQISDLKDRLDIESRERRISFNEAIADQRRQNQRESNERQRKFQQDLIDLQTQYSREIAAANEKRTGDLARALQQYNAENAQIAAKYNQQFALLKSAATKELTLLQQTEAQRVAIISASQNALLAQARAMLAASSSMTAASAIPLTGGVGNRAYIAPPVLHDGGMVTRTGLTLLKRGGVVTNPARGQSAPGGGLNVYINGAMTKEIDVRSKQHAIDTLVEYVTEYLG